MGKKCSTKKLLVQGDFGEKKEKITWWKIRICQKKLGQENFVEKQISKKVLVSKSFLVKKLKALSHSSQKRNGRKIY